MRRVENYIYDPSARIIKNPLNSTVFWKRRLNPATRRLNSATRPLNSATRQILHWNIVVYFDEASKSVAIKNAIMTPMAYHTVSRTCSS